ncbi:MAG: hypothetical protein WDM81_18900 [Rhizomicrobium sp.]
MSSIGTPGEGALGEPAPGGRAGAVIIREDDALSAGFKRSACAIAASITSDGLTFLSLTSAARPRAS